MIHFRIAATILIYLPFIVQVFCEHSSSSSSTHLKGDLVFAQILYRHGDRTPVQPYPTDPWRDLKYWPTGWGQLTNIGKLQHYQFGKWLRKRYNAIINDTSLMDNIYVQSTDVDRTLMSALSNLAGLCPPIGNEMWNKDLSWQPIPVHTIPEKEDFVLAAKKPCPAYNYAMSKFKQSDIFQKIDKQYTWMYKYLTKYSGQKINTPEAVERLYNTFYIEDLYNKTLPDWTKKVYPGGDMKWIASWSFSTMTYTRTLARLKAGPLLKEILKRFKVKASSSLKPNRSLWIYSGHDATVANLLNTLKLFEYHSPPYTSCVMMEMRLIENEPYLSIFYKNTTDEPKPMFIPQCGVLCPLDKMFQLYSDVLPDDWESECKMSMLSMTYEEADFGYAVAILFIIASVILLVISLYTCYLFYKRKNYSYFDYNLYTQIDH